MSASFSAPITDYEAESLIEIVFQKTTIFNKTTVLDFETGSERLLLAVSLALKTKAAHERTSVLDFGGACGLHFTLARLLFPEAEFRWAVVETHAMAKRARALETDRLKFFEDPRSAMEWLGQVDMINCNSALQYVEDPLRSVNELLGLAPKVALWERLMLAKGQTHTDGQRSMLLDHGPGQAPPGFKNRPVIQRIIRLSRSDFMASHEACYQLRAKSENSPVFSTYLFVRRND